MAKIVISAWEIAEKFGLTYVGELFDNPTSCYNYVFNFNGQAIKLEDYNGEGWAKDQAGEKVLLAIGRLVGGL